MKKINLCILWHMHQPYYKEPGKDYFLMPWTRLHAVKDYSQMARIIETKNIKTHFNFTPCLLRQLKEYETGAIDYYYILSQKKSSDLNNDEKSFILTNFFKANFSNLVLPYPRYAELLNKRGQFVTDDFIKTKINDFSAQDYTDLQVWFNLVWTSELHKKENDLIKGLFQKQKNFSDDDKQKLLSFHIDETKKIIPLYKKLHDENKIKLTCSPLNHPILPLLEDFKNALEGMPDCPLPDTDESLVDDAAYQIKAGKEYFKECFGFEPEIFWPSEGSVSEGTLRLLKENGVNYAFTDEGILYNSLIKSGRLAHFETLSADRLFKGYSYGGVNLLFRDHSLSDLIGFVYSSWDANKAAGDFVNHLRNIYNFIKKGHENSIVSVILDGENAWEYYPHNGFYFLNSFYDALINADFVNSVYTDDYFKSYNAEDIPKLFSGSWINSNFKIWMGHREKNTAWEEIVKIRNILKTKELSEEDAADAWDKLYIAESSDWFWWYGDDHNSADDMFFDWLFRENIKYIYLKLGMTPPDYLDYAIKDKKQFLRNEKEPSAECDVVIDGKVTGYFEWLYAGQLDINSMMSAMHKTNFVIEKIHWGYKGDNLFLRIDPVSFESFDKNGYTLLINANGNEFKIKIEKGKKSENGIEWAFDKIVEVKLSFSALNIAKESAAPLYISLLKDGAEIERWPQGYNLNIKNGDKELYADNWYV